MEEGEIELKKKSRSRELTPEWDQSSHEEKKKKNKARKSRDREKEDRYKEKDRDRKDKKKKDKNRRSQKREKRHKYSASEHPRHIDAHRKKQEDPLPQNLQLPSQQLQATSQEQLKAQQPPQPQQEDSPIQFDPAELDSGENIREQQEILRRRQIREEVLQKYEATQQQETRVQNEEEDEPQVAEQLQFDNNRQNYYKMLEQQRDTNHLIDEKKVVIDMFDDEEADIEDYQNQEIQIDANHFEVDDESKYYKIIIGEVIKDYKVVSKCGKGVFGNVCKAVKNDAQYAIKFIRSEDVYLRSGEREKSTLKELNESDQLNKKHIIRLIESFEHKKHLCLVFESMDINLREALATYTKNQGMELQAIRSYAMQLFVALSHLRKHRIIHADIKPDNILISQDTRVLKLCDFGTAFTVDEATVIEYLVSRYYRAPEIILGYPYDTQIDMWSTGCTLYELFAGQFLFTGDTNNEMLKMHIQTMGKFSMKMLTRSAFKQKYFDQQLNFLSNEKDPITKQPIYKPILLGEKPTRTISSLLNAKLQKTSEKEIKKLFQFRDLLEKCLQLDPKNRLTPEEALKHPFIVSQ